jgi:Type I phosphodiesterase / nucleotide pyrophosphatase
MPPRLSLQRTMSGSGAMDLVGGSKIPGLVTPQYDGRCISNLPDTFAELLELPASTPVRDSRFSDYMGTQKFDNVVFLLLDGFGFRSIERARARGVPALEKLLSDSVFVPLTSVFPSTTSTATTSLHTGLTPQEHGVLGYTTYMREIGAIVQMLDFCPIFSRRSLFEIGFEPAEFIGRKTIHERLVEAGIASKLYLSRYIVGSGLSQITNRGADIHPVIAATDLFTAVRRNLESTRGRSFHFAYHASPDTIAHARGPFSDEYVAEVESIFHSLRKELFEKLEPSVAKNTILLISADHGLAHVEARDIIDVARHGELLKMLKVPPTGDSRCTILHAKREHHIPLISEYFQKHFPDQFHVMLSSDALRNGLFGTGQIKPEVYDRLGDVIAVPRGGVALDNSNVQWRDDYVPGRHGGLSYDEMIVPLIAARLVR